MRRLAPAEETLEKPPISIRSRLKFNFVFLEILALAIRGKSKLSEYRADSQGERSQGLFEHGCWSFDEALGVRHCDEEVIRHFAPFMYQTAQGL